MIADIYNILVSDKNYKYAIETHDEITIILQQIKMLLGTKPGEVFGDIRFGINLEQYLFNLSYNKAEIEEKVRFAIINNIKYDTSKYIVNIEVNYGKDHVNSSDYALVDIIINERKCLGVVITQ